jgi:predicted RNA binding protein YcfA (HicA-like mRNA interferase family)
MGHTLHDNKPADQRQKRTAANKMINNLSEKKPLANTTYKLYIHTMNGKDLSAILKENGWTLDRVKGSHHIFIKPGKRSIPVPSKDLPKGLIRAILKQAEIPRR